MRVALLKFSQGATIGGDGRALIAEISASAVAIQNSDNTDVGSFLIELLYAPPDSLTYSGVAPGVAPPLVLAGGNGVPAGSLDLSEEGIYGCYRVRLTVWPGVNQSGNPDVDIRNVAVPTPNLRIILPPYQKFPDPLPLQGIGAKPDELNFSGQNLGWSGPEVVLSSSFRLVNETLRLVDLIGSGGGGSGVAAVFGRTGVVVAQPGDYAASQVNNDSGVAGSDVAEALDTLEASIPDVLRYIVGPVSVGGQFTTVQAAIDQAILDGASYNAPAVIFVYPGRYTENLSFTSSGICLYGLGDVNEWGAYIDGDIIWTVQESSSLACLTGLSVGGNVVFLGGVGAGSYGIEIENCSFFGEVSIAAPATPQFRARSTLFQKNAANALNLSTASTVFLQDCRVLSDFAAPGTQHGGDAFTAEWCFFRGRVECNGNFLTLRHCTVEVTEQTCLTDNVATRSSVQNCHFLIESGGSLGPFSIITKTGAGQLSHGGNSYGGAGFSRSRLIDLQAGTLETGGPLEPLPIYNGSSLMSRRQGLSFTGTGLVVTDDSGNGRTVVTVDHGAASDIEQVEGLQGLNVQEVLDNLRELQLLTQEPSGFPNRVDSALSFDDVLRAFSITPVGASYDIYIKGRRITKSGAETVVWPDVEGIHHFIFDNMGTLFTTQDEAFVEQAIIGDGVYVAGLSWSVATQESIMRGEERHGMMPGTTHKHFHLGWGARWYFGGALVGIQAEQNGSLDSHAQFGFTRVRYADEDIEYDVDHLSPQFLNNPARIPMFYRVGPNGDWRKKPADDFPLIYNGTAGYTGTLVSYNSSSGGEWGLTEASGNSFVLTHIFATNNIEEPIVGIVGQAQYGNAAEARAGADVEIANLLFGELDSLVAEFVKISTVIFQTNNSYSNTPKARIRSTEDGGDYVDFRREVPLGSGGGAPVTSVFNRTGAVQAQVGDYNTSQVNNSSSVSGGILTDALNTLWNRQIIAGDGLLGGGDLSTNRTLRIAAADSSIAVSADAIRVGVLQTDAQHGNRGGGSLHALATTSSAGFMSSADKTKLSGIAAGAQVNSVTAVFGRTGAVVAAASDYNASQIDNDSSVAGAFVDDALNILNTAVGARALSSVSISAGDGLTGGGNLTASRTIHVGADPGGSIVVSPDHIAVGVLATDAQHGVRGGGTQHAVATALSPGFMSSAHWTKLEGIASGAQVNSVTSVFGRTGAVGAAASDYNASQIDNDSAVAGLFVDDALDTLNSAVAARALSTVNMIAGNGLTGGGTLASNRTFHVGANPDGSIVVASDFIGVGVLATDAQHGTRGGGGLHAVATTLVNGFMSAADKVALNSLTSLAAGSVSGPASSTDNVLARYDGTSGKVLQNSDVTLSDTGLMRFDTVGRIGIGVAPAAAFHVRGGGNPELRLEGVAGSPASFIDLDAASARLQKFIASGAAGNGAIYLDIPTVDNRAVLVSLFQATTTASQASLVINNASGTFAPNLFFRGNSGSNLQMLIGDVTLGSATNSADLLMQNGSEISSSGELGIRAQRVFLPNSTGVPTTDPTGGGYLYVEAGALKYRGSSGTITTLGPA